MDKGKGVDDSDDDTKDSNYLIDGNKVDELDVNMEDYIDNNVEWMGVYKEATDSHNVDGDVYPFDVDQFSSGEENDMDGFCKERVSKKASHEHIQFYLGQTFRRKKTFKNLIKQHALESRRDIVIAKNEKERIRVVCRGTLPNLSETSGPGEPSRPGK